MMRAIGCEPKIQVRRVLEVTRVEVLAGCPGTSMDVHICQYSCVRSLASLKVKLKLLVEAGS